MTYRGIGSEFSWSGLPQPPLLPWPEGCWFARGRDALLAIWRDVSLPGGRLFIPSFFCPTVVKLLQHSRIPIVVYQDLPTQAAPTWTSLNAHTGDIVLAVNFFGVRCRNIWNDAQRLGHGATLVEDHTHDPLSAWARHSKADYAFASVRKTFATPDGAILWSPAGHKLPDQATNGDWQGSALKLAGMIYKRDAFENEAATANYREFEIQGERHLEAHGGPAISPWSRVLVENGFPVAWRDARQNNTRHFLDMFAALLEGNPRVQPLFRDWPQGHCPLNPVLTFRSASDREVVRQHLIRACIYAVVHWQIDPKTDPEAADLGDRILTVPLDHRCPLVEIPRIVNEIATALTTCTGQSRPADSTNLDEVPSCEL